MQVSKKKSQAAGRNSPHPDYDWKRVAHALHLSRALDEMEETRLVPEKKVLYQFSARGHDLAQILLGNCLTDRNDGAGGYYRSRPLLLALGVDPAIALEASMARDGGYSDGRDIGAVFNYANLDGPSAIPMCGGVGAQYTPTVGWAQAITYRRKILKDKAFDKSLAVVLGGDASVATNGFWAALTIATTLKLPVLFYIEDNGYGISTPGHFQTPGSNIAANLASFKNLKIYDGDGTEPREASDLIKQATDYVRSDQGPALLRLAVPRLSGHSAQDTQAYKSEERVKEEWSRDPLPRLKDYLVPALLNEEEWREIERKARDQAEDALQRALKTGDPDTSTITKFVFSENDETGEPVLQIKGGLWAEEHEFPASNETPNPEGNRINMVTAIRKTLDRELETNPKVLVFGEDVGPKGGVHAVTMGLQDKHGEDRVFDTSLSEEGIIGRAVGMALAGLMPVPEIQFRKYADPATEQLNDCGTMRWRTGNRFAAPIVVRIPGGFFKCGDPWHSQTGEVQWLHNIGWKLAMPSNAEDAVGLLRSAMRGNDPVIFFEHRNMLDAASARRPYPGDDYVLPFGKARTVTEGTDITVVAWGAMVERCEEAAKGSPHSVEVIDLRTLSPWDRDCVLKSVARTHRCLIVHEDNITAGFGAEIAATLVSEVFLELDAPVERLTMPDVPSPHSPVLLNAVVPGVQEISDKIAEMVAF